RLREKQTDIYDDYLAVLENKKRQSRQVENMEKTKEILNLKRLIIISSFLKLVPQKTVEENNNEDNELQSNSDVDGILNVAEEVTAGTSAGGSVVDEQIDEDDMVDNEDDNDSVDEGEIELTEEEKKKQKT
ncbi:hypothetical protein KQX54_000461, partial [Cotesia glomerata]